MPKKINYPEELTNEELTAKAMLAARDAYYQCIEQDGTECAYWSIKIEATHLAQDWKPLFIMTLDYNAQFSYMIKVNIPEK